MPRARAVVSERVARGAALVDRLARGRIAGRRARRGARREGERRRDRAHYDTKAAGTGTSPTALRRIAQCIASSPRMLAAALARSRLPNTGTAPR